VNSVFLRGFWEGLLRTIWRDVFGPQRISLCAKQRANLRQTARALTGRLILAHKPLNFEFVN
jgi:hypothetical protein